MQYAVKFKTKGSNKCSKLNHNLIASCVSEAWEEAKKQVPAGCEVWDVAPTISRGEDRVRKAVG